MDQNQPNETNLDLTKAIQAAVRLLKKARWLMAATGLLTIVAANLFLSRYVPNKYVSHATILVVDPQIAPSIVAPVSTSNTLDGVSVAVREVLSESRLLAIVNEFGLAPPGATPDDAVEKLQKNVEIGPSPPSFQITFSAPSPQLAHDVTQKLAELFLERNNALQTNQVKTAQSLIERQLADRRGRLSQLQASIAAFSGQHPDELSDERGANLQDLHDAKSKLDTVTANEETAKRRRTTLESTLQGRLSARITSLQEERTALLKKFTPKHPEVVNKDRQIAKAEAEIEQLKTGGYGLLAQGPSAAAAADPTIVQLEAELEANATELDSLSKDADRQRALIANYQKRLSANPIYGQQLNDMTRQADELNGEISDLTKKLESSDLSASMARLEEGQEFRLIDPASLPSHPSNRKKQTASLGAAVVGPLLGLILALFLDFLNPKFVTESDLRSAFAPPLVLSIPLLPTTRERRLHALRVSFEVIVGSAVVIVMAGIELYAYRSFSL